jgi:tetratricopeptide (TPR) repeat protein
VASLAFVVLWGACPAGAAPLGALPFQSPSVPDAQAVKAAALVKQLDSADAEARHAASVELRNMTGAVLPAVEEAAKSAGDAAKVELGVVLPMLRGRANMEARRRAERDRNLSTALEAYDQVGKHDPKWDDAAREAIRAFVWPGDDAERTPADHERRLAAFKKAMDAGCRDPLILYFHTIALGEAGAKADAEPVLVRMKVAQDLLDSDYPPERKIPAVLRFLDAALAIPYRLHAPADVVKAADADMAKAMDLFPEAARRADASTAHWLAQSLIDLAEKRAWTFNGPGAETLSFNGAGGPEFDRKTAFDRLFPAMDAAVPGKPEPLEFKGRFYADYAWDARGRDVAANVTPEGWKGFYQRLGVAERALTDAYDLDPANPSAATEMITVMMGKGGGRERMEVWFRRAMAADPDNLDACAKKLYYLAPKWHGSAADQIAFGQECRRTENWRGRIPLVLLDAYNAVGDESGDRIGYLDRDEVWADIRSLYDQYLTLFPDRLVGRARFIQLAGSHGKWDDVYRHCQLLGDVPPPGVFHAPSEYTQLREQAATQLGKVGPSKPGAAKAVAAGSWYDMREADSTGLATYVAEALVTVAAGVAVILILRARRRKGSPPVPGA